MAKFLFKDKIQIIFTCVWILSIGFFIVSVFILSISQNVYSENYEASSKITINALLPQGWGFFTKNPNDIKYKFYRIEDTSIILVNEKNSSGANFLGLSRKYRRFNYECGKIYSTVKPLQWKISKVNKLNTALYHNPITLTLDQEYRLIPNGKYIIIKYEDVPWAWANDVHNAKILGYVPINIKR